MESKQQSAADVIIVDIEGARATAQAHQLSIDGDTVIVTLADGREAHIASNLFEEREDNTYYVPLRLGEVVNSKGQHREEEIVIPLIEEQLRIRKVQKPGDQVRVIKRVEETIEEIAVPLEREKLDMRRVAVKRIVDQPQALRRAGDTIIIPVHEEVVVVEKRTMVVEEIHITVERFEEIVRQQHTLRREVVDVEQQDLEESSHSSS